jgi:hypothetical protein
MNGKDLSADALDAGAVTGTIYKGCGTLAYNSTVGTIQIYEQTYGSAISIADAADVTENDLTDVNQEFVVSVSPANCVATTFDYSTAAGTAVSPADFTAIATTSATVPAGASSLTLTVVTKPDALNEGNESYTVALSNVMANVTVADASGQGTILDDDNVPTPIYRSVGGATMRLHCGINSSLLFASGTATFPESLPDNVGVGDVVRFDANSNGDFDGVVMITERVNATTYKVQMPDGSVPPDMSQVTPSWDVFRAYSSLADAENGTESPLIFNDPNCGGAVSCDGGSCATLANFDSWSGGKDIVASNEQWNFAFYADAADTNYVEMNGWTTGPVNHIRVFTPVAANEVGVSQRHNGVWDNTKARLIPGDDAIAIQDDNVTIDGLQIECNNMPNNLACVFSDSISSAGEVRISNNIIRQTGTAGTSTRLIHLTSQAGEKIYIWNNILYGNSSSRVARAINIDNITNWVAYIYNNTTVNTIESLNTNGGLTTLKNHLMQGCDTGLCWGVYGGGTVVDSVNNLSSDATADDYGGTGNRINKSVTFVDAVNEDFRLSVGDTEAKGFGEDLSADAALDFVTDISGLTRTSPWDIGASNAVP